MSREIKYTSDGKKVVVIGSLNSTDKIVQEIFVIDGSEIPSGEHFVVKSLHDAPAESWKDKNLRQLEENYERRKNEINQEETRLKKSWNAQRDLLRGKIEWAAAAIKTLNPEVFQKMVDFITDEIKFIVTDRYDPELLTMDQFKQLYEDKLRLVSIFGRTDGSMVYKINEYYDGSGGWTQYMPFKDYQSAFEYFKQVLLKKGPSERSIATAAKYGIIFPKEDLDEYYSGKIESLSKNVAKYQEDIRQWESQINFAKEQVGK